MTTRKDPPYHAVRHGNEIGLSVWKGSLAIGVSLSIGEARQLAERLTLLAGASDATDNDEAVAMLEAA